MAKAKLPVKKDVKPALNLFDVAATVVVPTKESAGKRVVVDDIANIKKYAMLDAASKEIDTLMGTIGSKIEAAGFDKMFAAGVIAKAAPESIDAVEGIANINIQAKKRATNSKLAAGEVTMLGIAGIKAHEEVEQDEQFAVNTKYGFNMELLVKVSNALAGIVEADFFVKIPKKSKYIVTKDMLALAYQAEKPDVNVVKMMTVMALKPTLKTVNMDEILKEVGKMISEEKEKV